jgi:RNA ligase
MLNYEFPTIKNINDVLPHIEGRPEFRVIEKDWYIVVNYSVAFEETFQWDDNDLVGSAIRRECRGLIFNQNKDLISRPYSKFFNVGEKEETQIHEINFHEHHCILEKLDGSMVRPIPTADGFLLATRAGVTDVSMNAQEFIANKPNYSTFINLCISQETTPIFEWCSRKNRIVIDYPEDQLILTGIRYNNTGAYVEYESMKRSASYLDIPFVKSFASGNVFDEEQLNSIRKWDDGEGVVLRFDSGHMVKIKADDYVLRHKTKEQIGLEKNVLQIILNDAVDDLVPLLTPEDAERIQRFQTAFWASVDDVAYEMAELFIAGNSMYPDQKDFAVEFVQKKVLPIHVPIMYAMKSGRGAKEVLVNMIGNSISTQPKVDKNRWMWKSLNWNHTDIHINN